MSSIDAPSAGPGTNTGHGHVWRRPDGVRARCGGPGACGQCSRDAARWLADQISQPPPMTPERRENHRLRGLLALIGESIRDSSLTDYSARVAVGTIVATLDVLTDEDIQRGREVYAQLKGGA